MKKLFLLQRYFVLVAAFVVCIPFALAQGTSGGTSGGAGSGSTGGTRGGTSGSSGMSTGRTPSTGGMTSTAPRMSSTERRRPIILQGVVLMKDGSPTPPQVVIERVCGGRPIPEAYTDGKGKFSFEVGRNNTMINDASWDGRNSIDPVSRYSGSFGQHSIQGAGGASYDRELMGCRIQASLPGYRSSTVELSGRRYLDNPDIGAIVLTKISGVEGSSVSFSSLKAPKNAQKAFNNGVKEAQKKNPKWAKIEKELNKAIEFYPEYASAWYLLGSVYQTQNRMPEARNAYTKAMEADEKFIQPYSRIVQLDASEGKWNEVAEIANRIVKLNPYDFPDAYFYRSVANLNLRNLNAAEECAREAIEHDMQEKFPQLEQILGVALAGQMKYEEAAVHLKKYLELAPEAQNAAAIKTQLTQIETYLASKPATQQ